jgi:hypothetical protein
MQSTGAKNPPNGPPENPVKPLGASWNRPFWSITPTKRGIYAMYALNWKVLVLVVCALAMATVMHSLVYLSIDSASLSAEMPPR